MSRYVVDGEVALALVPVAALLEEAVGQLPQGPVLQVSFGATSGFWELDGEKLVLSDALRGPGLHHPDEVPAFPLDRWRRIAGSILEGVVAASLRARGETGVDWRFFGYAVLLAHRALPALQLLEAEAAWTLATGDLGVRPRAGVVCYALAGDDEAGRWQRGEGPDAAAWTALCKRILDPQYGPQKWLSVPVAHPAERDIPLELGAWSFAALSVPAHPRGGHVVVDGPGIADPAWAVGGLVHKALAASAERGARFLPEPGGPLGAWEVRTSAGFGQVYGVRGVAFTFRGSGVLEIVLADAFVGPPGAIDVAEQVGTSGSADGRWTVAGDHRLRFSAIDVKALTMHGRDREAFAVPAAGLGLETVLKALGTGDWRWSIDGDRLTLAGSMLGGDVEVRLKSSLTSGAGAPAGGGSRG